ncbi:hypothetical protein NLI96_g7203 [Meripilus lineatus]|uniref:Rds1 protein n=1 Tax=Meripilus lineatus TaxID=2056292 RepID=A0AAD5UZV0_9APHY|nr:hypothetical protein NLI96_g7203 [Physisporinus lineatus]
MIVPSALLALAFSEVAFSLPSPAAIPGGAGLNETPVYQPLSPFDYQSFILGLNQEYLEFALFQDALNTFSDEQFAAAGFTPNDQYLVQYMLEQEVGHITLIQNILGGPDNAPKACNYSFPFETVQDFVDLSMKITRTGESGVFGFIDHLDSRAAATVLGQAVAVESRQQMVFRQFEGLFPFPYSFIPVISQAMAWTAQTQFTTSCPATNPKIEWQAFPYLNITNAPNGTALPDGNFSTPSLSSNRTLSQPGNTVNLAWDAPGMQVGPDKNYTTTTNASAPKFAAWVSQLNTTYTPLTNISGNTAQTLQPDATTIFGNDTSTTVNGTIFVLITDTDLYVTPFNFSLIDAHVVAGPALYIAG